MPNIKDLERRIAELERVIQSLKNTQTIPYDIRNALTSLSGSLKSSSKGKDTEDQAVNEGGAATYNVPKEYDGFDERNDKGVTKYYGYYT